MHGIGLIGLIMLQWLLIIMAGRGRHRSRSIWARSRTRTPAQRFHLYLAGRMWVINTLHPSDSEIYWSRTSRLIKIKRILKVVCQCGVIVLGNC